MPKSSFKPNYQIGKPIRRRPPADTSTDDQINRINELSRTARATWLSLLGYLAFVGVTLLGVEDVDFFDPSRQTDLPLIGVAIPTASFFIFAPILGAALYIYLHLYLLKLWDELATVPNTHKNAPISDHLTPWLINDLGLSLRTDEALRKRPLGRLSKWVTIALVFLAGPMILAGFWVRSFPALNEWMTLFIAALVYLALRSGFISWRYLRNLIKGTDITTTKRYNILNPKIAAPFLFGLVTISWLATEGDFDFYTGVKITGLQPLARANLSGQNLSERPKEWRDINTAQRRFRATWSRRQNIPLDTCGQIYRTDAPAPTNLTFLRENWCETKSLTAECTLYFAKLDKRFLTEWTEERKSLMIGVKTANLEKRDLRNANLSEAFLVQANLKRARLERANLWRARLEGANFRSARLERAYLVQARLEGANFRWARLDGAILSEARLERASLSLALLEGANLQWARLEGANLKWARLEVANLSSAQFQSVEWAGAKILNSPAHSTDFRGAKNLTQGQLETVIGDKHTLMPMADKGTDALFVWSCWDGEKLPDNFQKIFAGQRLRWETIEDTRAKYICPEGTSPQPTGTPWPLNKPRPAGHPLGD